MRHREFICCIYDDVVLGDNVELFPFCVIGRPPGAPKGTTTQNYGAYEPKGVRIGNNTVIGANAVIYDDVTIGDNVLIGDGVVIRENVQIDDNVIIGINTKIGTRTVIGHRVKIMDLTNIASDAVIEPNVFISQGVMMGNDNTMGRRKRWENGQTFTKTTIKRYSTIGMNASILPGVTVHQDSIVGAGAVVTKDVMQWTVVMGVPAKKVRDLEKQERRI